MNININLNLPLFILILCTFLSYLIGSFSMSYLISKKKKINLKEKGSKNLGTSNTVILIGVKEGLIVLLSDVFKIVIAMSILSLFCNWVNEFSIQDTSMVNCKMLDILSLFAIAGILGHIFPIHLNFNGGKGFASYIGAILTLSFIYPSLLLILVIALILAFISDYIVMATFTVISLTPIYFLYIKAMTPMICFLIISIIIFIKHIENIKRIKNGQELKIRKALKKK